MRLLTLSILAAATLLMAGLVAWSPWRDAQPAVGADASVVTTLAMDMVPAGNDDHTVGFIDNCVQVSAGATVQFDVVLDAIPAGVGASDLKGYQYFMGFDAANLTFITQTNPNNDCPPADGVQMFCRATNSCSGALGCVYGGEGVPEPPDSGSPASPGVHDVFVTDSTSGATVGGGSDPYGKAGGVLGRYTIQVSPTATPGIYGIGLNSNTIYDSNLSDRSGGKIWDLPGNGADDDNDGGVDEDVMLDATVGYGLIAVDVACSEGPPAPTPTASPTPAASPTPPSSPTPSVSPTPGAQQTNLVPGWNNACYLGPTRPIEEALADIREDVIAVYRLGAGQQYEGWFPGKLDAGAIETLDSYEPLLILMANSTLWTQQTLTSPPTVGNLSEGWNSVCYAGETRDAGNATASIEGKFVVLYVLGSNQSWLWFSPDRTDASTHKQLVRLEPVLILVTESGGTQWMFDA